MMQQTAVLIHGSTGTMGHVLIDLIGASDSFTFAGGVSNRIAGDEPYPIFEKLSDVDVDYDVIIDFTHFSLIDDLIREVELVQKPVVLATTGLSAEQEAAITALSEKVAVFRAKNFSIGINLLAHLIRQAQQVLAGFDIEIIEKHHNRKVDAPSGTAYFLADALNAQGDHRYQHGREGNQSLRSKEEIGIHAIRGGTIVGEHSVIFAGTDEVIELKHEAHSKKVFAHGALSAAAFIADKPAGYYDMDDLMSKGE